MNKYKDFKTKIMDEKKRLLLKKDNYDRMVDLYNRKSSAIADVLLDKKAYPKSIGKLKKFFPEYSRQYEILERINYYMYLIQCKRFTSIDREEMKKILKDGLEIFNEKDLSMVKMIDHIVMVCQSVQNDKRKEKVIIKVIGGNGKGLIDIFEDLYDSFSTKTNNLLKEALKKQEVPKYVYDEIDSIDKRVAELDSINAKFSFDEIKSSFDNDEEINDLIKKIGNLLTNDELIELLSNIKDDILNRNEEETEKISFSNLDLDKFNDEDKKIIEEIREIIEDEELNENNVVFENKEISYNERINLYEKCSVNDMLLDVKQNLLEHIYDNKEVIKIFKYIIDKYRIYSTNVLRNEKIVELLRIKSDFNNIISFINKSYKDREDAFMRIKEITSIIETIDTAYIPVIKEMIEDNLDFDEFFDNEIDKLIDQFRRTIKGWKKKMSSSYQEEISEEEVTEDTGNLVFCLTEIDLSNGADKEFTGTVEALETRSSQELKKSPGRKGMTRIRKTTEHGKEKDFVEYLESRFKTKIKFVPYRYSSEPDYRTGLIKFEPSSKVKEFLENHYGLSRQSAYYGIFHVITSIRADHTEYYYLERYIIKNYGYIKELSELFASDEPDYDKLTSVLDELINKKKVLLSSIQNTMN